MSTDKYASAICFWLLIAGAVWLTIAALSK
jgi:hypothetical protein